MSDNKLDQIKKLMKAANMDTDPAKLFNNKAFKNVSKLMGVEQKQSTDKIDSQPKKSFDFQSPGTFHSQQTMRASTAPIKKQLKGHEGLSYISAVHFLNEHANDIGYTNTIIKEYKNKLNEVMNHLIQMQEDLNHKFNLSKDISAFIDNKLEQVFNEIKEITGKQTAETARETKRSVPKEEKRILIIENSITQRTLIKTKLDELGYKYIAEEKSGQKGLETILEHYTKEEDGGIDLIIMDLELPELSGRNIIQTLRTSEYAKEYPDLKLIPILIISNYKMTNPDGGELSKEQLDLLNLEQMEKPFKEDIFVQSLKKMFPEDF